MRHTPARPRVLFILKRRTGDYEGAYGGGYTHSRSSGLFNSVAFVVAELENQGFQAEFMVVTDNNDIDREVASYRPTHVLIEALWVVPEKFAELKRLHPSVKWAVRLHSEVPFVSMEGIACDWVARYLAGGVAVACNSERMAADLQRLHPQGNIPLLPNFYPLVTSPGRPAKPAQRLDIGCLGAIRPLKNTLIQAVAAVEFARASRRHLYFHINSNRVEQRGDPVLKNLRALFKGAGSAELVEHPWVSHTEFLKLVAHLDLSMQVSFSETFNIVTADAVACHVPVVVSPEISWVPRIFHAAPTSVPSIVAALGRAWGMRKVGGARLAKAGLSAYNRRSMKQWKACLQAGL